MNHPLTDEMIRKIFNDISNTDWNDYGEYEDHLIARAVYDLAIKQVIEQWEEVNNSDRTIAQIIRHFDRRLKAMRPQ